jgi:homospermidine synthase
MRQGHKIHARERVRERETNATPIACTFWTAWSVETVSRACFKTWIGLGWGPRSRPRWTPGLGRRRRSAVDGNASKMRTGR